MYTCFKVQNINQGGHMYYILTGLELANPSNGYIMLFGDYDKEVVKDEKIEEEYNNRISGEYANLELHRLSNDKPQTIEDRIYDLNQDAHYNFKHNRK